MPINELEQHPYLSINFTSTSLNRKSPPSSFLRLFDNSIQLGEAFRIGSRIWSKTCIINFNADDSQKYTMYFLPTPKPRGIHWTKKNRTLIFENYLKQNHSAFYIRNGHLDPSTYSLMQLKVRSIFLVKTYQQAIKMQNVNFDGGNII